MSQTVTNIPSRRRPSMPWRWLRVDLGLLGWALVTAALLSLGGVAHMFWVEWLETEAVKAQIRKVQPRGFIGIVGTRPSHPPPQPIRQSDGKTFLWAKSDGVDGRWYDVTDCLLPLKHFNFELGNYAGVRSPIRVSTDHVIAKRLMPGDAVMGVSVQGTHCAYPDLLVQRVLVVNDTLGGRNVALLYVPPRYGDQAVIYNRDAVQPAPVLELTGYAYAQQPVLYDRATGSLWYATVGTGDLVAISGPMRGTRLPMMFEPERVSWGDWEDRHGDTQVLIGADRRQFSRRDESDDSSTITATLSSATAR